MFFEAINHAPAIFLAMQRIDYIIMSCAALVLIFVGIALLPGAPTTYNLDAAYDKGCTELREKRCDPKLVTSITALVSGKTTYTLGVICSQRGFGDTVSCANSCGCNSTATGEKIFDTPVAIYSDRPVLAGTITIEGDEGSNETY